MDIAIINPVNIDVWMSLPPEYLGQSHNLDLKLTLFLLTCTLRSEQNGSLQKTLAELQMYFYIYFCISIQITREIY